MIRVWRSVRPVIKVYRGSTLQTPVLLSVSPALIPNAGGTSLTFSGYALAGVTSMSFGGTVVAVTPSSDTTIVVSSPFIVGFVGTLQVTASNLTYTSNALALAMYALPAPMLTSLSVTSGSPVGGTTTHALGSNFSSTATWYVGGTALVSGSVHWNSANDVTLTMPTHTAGVVDVAVVNPDAQSSTLPGAFTYVVATAPTVTSLSVTTGPAAGGTSTTITGTNFVTGATVQFGASSFVGAAFVDASHLTVTTPAQSAGAATVTVKNPDNQTGSLPNAFTYVATPTVASISPNYGSTGATRDVMITGTNYLGIETVTVNGTSCAVTAHTSTTLSVTVPAGVTRGIGNVVVANVGGSNTLTSGYFAMAITAWVDPNYNVHQTAGVISSMIDPSGTTCVVPSNSWVAVTGAAPLFVANAFGPRNGVDTAGGTALFGGQVAPYSATKVSSLAIAKITVASGYGNMLGSGGFAANRFSLGVDSGGTHPNMFAPTLGTPATASGTTITDGVLRTYVGTRGAGASNNVNIYLNGGLAASATDAATLGAAGDGLGLGAFTNSAGSGVAYYASGIYAEAFCEATEWTPTEVAFLSSKTTVGSPAYLAGVP